MLGDGIVKMFKIWFVYETLSNKLLQHKYLSNKTMWTLWQYCKIKLFFWIAQKIHKATENSTKSIHCSVMR